MVSVWLSSLFPEYGYGNQIHREGKVRAALPNHSALRDGLHCHRSAPRGTDRLPHILFHPHMYMHKQREIHRPADMLFLSQTDQYK